MSFWEKLQEAKWEWAGFGLLVVAVLINRFPDGYIVLGGDVLQPINMREQFAGLHYGWFAGRISIFYSLFYFLDTVGVSNTAQLSWYVGVFLFGAYGSFLLFGRLVFPGASRAVWALVALFYATNIYTLYVFTSTWGYTHYQILYVFIPALTGLYWKVLTEHDWKRWSLGFFAAVFLASTSFGNPAFAVSLGIFFVLLTVGLLVFGVAPWRQSTVVRVGFLAVVGFLLNAYWILPLLPQVRAGVESVAASQDIVLADALQKTSNAIFDSVRLMQTHEQNLYYPKNFPYPSFGWAEQPLLVLALVPFVLVLVGLAWRKRWEKDDRKRFLVFFGLFVVFVALVARVRFPFDAMNNFLFQLPGFNTMRGYDKTAIITPFLLSALLVATLASWQKVRHFRWMLGGFWLMTVLLALPFYAGGLQTRMSYILAGQKAKNYETAKYSALVKIPDGYFELDEVIRRDPGDWKFAPLPYSPGSSVGRVNLPEWKVNGPNSMRGLYTKSFVEPNEEYIPSWKFADEFQDSRYDPQWIVDLYGLLGVKYILYHKDARQENTEQMEPAREYLERKGVIQLVLENDSFRLYRIAEDKVFPYVYGSSGQILVAPDPALVSTQTEGAHQEMKPVLYRKETPGDIFVSAKSLAGQARVFLNEPYNLLWQAEYVAPDGSRTVLERDTRVLYANAWHLDASMNASGTIEVFFLPIKRLLLGEYVTGTTLVVLVLWGVGGRFVRRKSETV